jgi:hypothetical protein
MLCHYEQLRQIVQENNVGGVPEVGGDGAAGLAGDNDFEEFGGGGQAGQENVFRIRRKRLR